ncbi:hypothetical protein IEO21_04092 [Rhodonia placenta]|uniref:Uncharacterized protein n=1 Tax=Rhodonia placenta TaxID=104341 RepID=A0A8H7U2W7_9APHY|nr:hypothetical protein IEO21_04092 [Postia placenta]
MPSTRPGAHIGAGKTPSMALPEMFWLVAEVSVEVQINWWEGKTERGVGWRERAALVTNVVDKATATALLDLNMSRAPGQSLTNRARLCVVLDIESMVLFTRTGQLGTDIPSRTPHLAKILVLFELSSQYSLILFLAVVHVNNDVLDGCRRRV